MTYKYFGLLATVILIAGLTFVARRWPAGRHKTFSQHVAPRRSSTVFYFGLFCLVLPLLVAFFIGWFTPHFGLTHWLNVTVVLSALFQLACTLVPETKGRQAAWHRALAGVSAILLVPAVAIIATAPSLAPILRPATWLGLGVMASCIYLVARAKGEPKNFLIIQTVYFAAFLLPVLLVSYLS